MIALEMINGTSYAPGLWTDANNNVLIEGNVVLHINTMWGAIFVEASNDFLMLRHNIVVDVNKNKGYEIGGSGLYSHTCEDVKTTRNISLGCEGSGIAHHSIEPLSKIPDIQRIDGGSGASGTGFDTFDNVVSDCTHLVTLGSGKCEVDGNIYGSHHLQAPLRIERPSTYMDLDHWRKNFDFDINGRTENIKYSLENSDTKLVLTIGEKTYNIDLMADNGPQIDKIFE